MTTQTPLSSKCEYWIDMPTFNGETVEMPSLSAPGTTQTWYRATSNVDGMLQCTVSTLPNISDPINITMNSIGPAVVRGYMAEFGMIGIIAEPTSPPDWWVAQNAKNAKSKLFGVCGVYPAEIS